MISLGELRLIKAGLHKYEAYMPRCPLIISIICGILVTILMTIAYYRRETASYVTITRNAKFASLAHSLSAGFINGVQMFCATAAMLFFGILLSPLSNPHVRPIHTIDSAIYMEQMEIPSLQSKLHKTQAIYRHEDSHSRLDKQSVPGYCNGLKDKIRADKYYANQATKYRVKWYYYV